MSERRPRNEETGLPRIGERYDRERDCSQGRTDMRVNTNSRSDEPEPRIPTWDSRPWAIIGVVAMAVAFAATTPAARIAIDALGSRTPARVTAGADLDAAGPTEVEAPVAPTDRGNSLGSARPDAGSTRSDWTRAWGIEPREPSERISRRSDRPDAGRRLAVRLFAGLFRHLEAGLRHLTTPAVGSGS